ncbi:MAG: LCP family protein [Culicoidibacterales bacterium]
MEQQTRKTRKKAKKKKRTGLIITSLVLVFFIILGLFQMPQILSLFSSFENISLTTASKEKNQMGLLILGVDNNGGYTDSITYIAANFDSQKAIALPIYRDASINVVCAGETVDNINRIYSKYGIECLAQSTSAFLGLPIDNFAVLTMEGLVKIVSELGEIIMKPTETFCSNFGSDKSVEYCFTKGEDKKMVADEVIAYLRYRGGGNGENRANRQVQLIQALKNKCSDEMMLCYQKAAPYFGDTFKTNIGITKITTLSNVFGSTFTFETLPVIAGINEQSGSGWTQIVDQEDKNSKTGKIKAEIFN